MAFRFRISLWVFFAVFVQSLENVTASATSTVSGGWSRRRFITEANLVHPLSRASQQNLLVSTVSNVAVSQKRHRNSGSERKTAASRPKDHLTVPQRLISGGCSRGIAQMIMYPVDALRTLAQTRDGRTLADVGAKALVRGCATTSSFAIFIGAIQFAIFGATKEACGPMVSSALGAAGSCLVSIPQEVIKQRLVTGVYSNFRSAVATIYRSEGILGFYSAWRPTVARNVPFVVATFTSMDALKEFRLQQKRKDANASEDDPISLSFAENLVIGISSSLIGATLTHPVGFGTGFSVTADVIKTRMMTQAASTAVPYTSTIDCIRTIWRTEGIRSFYSGFAQRSVYMGPLWAIQFALNGAFHEGFRNRKNDLKP